ncbi:MAG: aminoglycoside phosphotransferase family protein [Lentilitoribacter sp.]
MSDIDLNILEEFDVSSPLLIAETAIAKVWRVKRSDNTLAALKVYKGPDMLNEAAGVVYLQNCNGEAAARIYQSSTNAFLMEYLGGQTLGDLTLCGEDHEAANILVETAKRLRRVKFDQHYDWPKLDEWIKELIDLKRGSSWSDKNWQHIVLCRQLAKKLISNQTDISVLHGDLHHNNIMKGARGYCAIDAKGVLGDRCYELANAMCNPIGAEELMIQPDRIEFLLNLWSTAFEIDRNRFLEWIIAQRGMSISWSGNDIPADHISFKLLDIFIGLYRS